MAKTNNTRGEGVPSGAGNFSKLHDPRFRARALELFRAGNYRVTVAKAIGVAPRTFFRWTALGKKGKQEPFATFYQEMVKAEQEAETAALEGIMSAARRDPDHFKWFLERKFPQRWGRDTHKIRELEKAVRELTRRLFPDDEPGVDSEAD